MGKTKYVIYLTEEECAQLIRIIETEPEKTALRAKILLESDFNNPTYSSAQKLADTLGTSHTTVQIVRAEYAKYGLMGCIYPKGTLSYDKCAIITSEKRSQIIDLLKDRPPYGLRRWTIKAICDECMKKGIFEYVSYSAIQKFLKAENIDLTDLKTSLPDK